MSQARLDPREVVGRQLPEGIEHDNRQAPAQRSGDAVAGRILRGMDGHRRDTTCPHLGGAVHQKQLLSIS